ncbi:MAG TPA: carbohydrate ABC transporter permease, partial [Thermotogota bacterium]|nr:carbohydrate ABC transporter permease [Thermotogota bacterium]
MRNRKRTALKTLVFLIVIGALLWTLIPLAWIFLSSFKYEADKFSVPPRWFPGRLTLQNYAKFFGNAEFVRSFLNSIMVTLLSTLIALGLGVPTAYSLARFNWKHSNSIAFVIVLARMTPPIVMVLPFFMIARY